MAFLDRAYFSLVFRQSTQTHHVQYYVNPVAYGMFRCSNIAVILTSHLSLAWQGCMENEFMRIMVSFSSCFRHLNLICCIAYL
jgi:hypothetical protein